MHSFPAFQERMSFMHDPERTEFQNIKLPMCLTEHLLTLFGELKWSNVQLSADSHLKATFPSLLPPTAVRYDQAGAAEREKEGRSA